MLLPARGDFHHSKWLSQYLYYREVSTGVSSLIFHLFYLSFCLFYLPLNLLYHSFFFFFGLSLLWLCFKNVNSCVTNSICFISFLARNSGTHHGLVPNKFLLAHHALSPVTASCSTSLFPRGFLQHRVYLLKNSLSYQQKRYPQINDNRLTGWFCQM